MSEPQIHRAKRNAVVLAAMFGLSTLAHLGRDVWLARSFGTGRAIEAFELVFVLPGMLARFFGGGMMTALIPRASALLDATGRSTRAFWNFQGTVGARAGVLVALLLVGGALFAERIAGLLAAGPDQEVVAIGAPLLRILLPSLLVTLVLGLMLAACHALQRYVVASVAGVLAPVVYLAFLTLGAEALGIRAAAWGFVSGQLAALLLVAIALLRPARESASAGLPVGDAEVGETLRAIGLVLASWLTSIVNLQVDLSMASTLEPGSVPSLRYAFRLVQLPAGLFFSTVGVVLLPTLSQAITTGDVELLRRALRFGCRVVAVLLLPAAVLLFVLAEPIVELLYQRGAFAIEDTARTAAALRAYAAAVVAYGYLNVVLSILHARRRQGAAAVVGVAMALANVILNLLLMPRYGVAGIAASTSLVVSANVAVVVMMEPELRTLLRSRPLQSSLLRAACSCATMCVGLWALDDWFAALDGRLLPLAARGAFGIAIFVAALAAMRGGELTEVRAALQKRTP